MKFSKELILVLGMSALFSQVRAETTAPAEPVKVEAKVSVKQESPQFQPKITGMFYTATQYAPTSGDLDAWNLARLGVQFTQNFNLSYNQILLNDYRTRLNSGFNFRLDDAYVRAKWNEILSLSSPDLKFGLEQRYYIPTSTTSSEKTMVGGLRNRLLTQIKVNDTFSLGLEESPVVYWYRDVRTGKGINEIFRNYFVVTPTLTAMKGKLNFFFPLYVQNSLHRESFGGAGNRGPWKHQVFLWPEVTYSVNDTLELGLTAVTGNLFSDDLVQTTFSSAFKDVLTALEVTLSI